MPTLFGIHWWALALRGVVAILFGLLTFSVPGITLAVIVILFGAYAFVDGIVAIVSAVRAAHGHGRWGAFLVEGIVGILAGLVTFFMPILTLAVLVYLVAAWAIVTGVLEIVAAFRLRRYVTGEWLLVLAGIASVIFGVLVFLAPLAGAVVIAWWLGAYALVFGILLLVLAFRLRSLQARAAPAV
jgi:uncharacterized membrane protein HdeD (DUF308 family)